MKHTTDFVEWFRAAAPYIHGFRGKTFVIAFGGELVADANFVQLAWGASLVLAALTMTASAGGKGAGAAPNAPTRAQAG